MSKKEKIIETVLNDKIKNLTTEKYNDLYNTLVLQSDITSIAKLYKQVAQMLGAKYTTASAQYWECRGWSKPEAYVKAKECTNSRKKHPSPFSVEFWISKINPDTNKLYTEVEAEFKRNSMRPIRKEYWIKLGHDNETASRLAAETKEKNNHHGALASKSRDAEMMRAISKRTEDYWLLRGYSQQDATKMVKQHQSTFSLAKCIENFGEADGTVVWEERQLKWQRTLNNKPQEEQDRINRSKVGPGVSVSKAEKYIYDSLKLCYTDICHQFPLHNAGKKVYIYDMQFGNKLIEYNGDYWHMNPTMYTENQINSRSKRTAKDIWNRDSEKVQFAIDSGYDVLIIWEHDFKLNKQDVINKCINFLKPQNENLLSRIT